jgi:hypothetical protein
VGQIRRSGGGRADVLVGGLRQVYAGDMTMAPAHDGPPLDVTRALGVPPGQLADEVLDRELARLHATRRETFMHGSEDALEAHTGRMLALEGEFLRRFPERVQPDAARTRAGSRHAAGQR